MIRVFTDIFSWRSSGKARYRSPAHVVPRGSRGRGGPFEVHASRCRARACHHVVRNQDSSHARAHTHLSNTKGYSSTYLAIGFANVRAGTQKRRDGCPAAPSCRTSTCSLGTPLPPPPAPSLSPPPPAAAPPRAMMQEVVIVVHIVEQRQALRRRQARIGTRQARRASMAHGTQHVQDMLPAGTRGVCVGGTSCVCVGCDVTSALHKI